VAAGGALTSHIVHEITAPTRPQQHAHIPRQAAARSVLAATSRAPVVSVRTSNLAAGSSKRETAHHRSPAPPSKSLGYLALGGSSGKSSSSTSVGSPSSVRATAASVGQADEASSSEAPQQPTQSGGGTSLNYLGK
jgi:hypothetical protein